MSEGQIREANEVFKEDIKKMSAQQRAQADVPQQQSYRQDDMKDFEVPTELVPLPSNGLVYPATSPLHNREEIEIRCMTANDENVLTSRALLKKGTVIEVLLKNCLVNKLINVSEMLVGDRNAIMIALRITGYGSDYTTGFNCDSCSKQVQETFQLTELPIKRLNIQPLEPYTNRFLFTLPKWKKDVIFKFMTGADESELMKTFERARKISEIESVVTTQLINSIISIDGNEDRAFISKVVGKMPSSDSLALRSYINENEPGIDMKSYFTCSNCGYDGEVEVPIGPSFLWPQGRR